MRREQFHRSANVPLPWRASNAAREIGSAASGNVASGVEFQSAGAQVLSYGGTLSNTNAELIQTQARLRDLSRASDERHQQLVNALARARADLAAIRAWTGHW